jgi:hypothetical protein
MMADGSEFRFTELSFPKDIMLENEDKKPGNKRDSSFPVQPGKSGGQRSPCSGEPVFLLLLQFSMSYQLYVAFSLTLAEKHWVCVACQDSL